MVVKTSTFDKRRRWNRSLEGQLGLMTFIIRLLVKITAVARYFTGSLTYDLVPSVRSFHNGTVNEKQTPETTGALQPPDSSEGGNYACIATPVYA